MQDAGSDRRTRDYLESDSSIAIPSTLLFNSLPEDMSSRFLDKALEHNLMSLFTG